MYISSIGNFNSLDKITASLIMKEKGEESSFQATLDNAAKTKDEAQLKKACQEFESYFLQTMFKEMRKSVHSEQSFLPKSQSENIFQDMLDEEISKNVSSAGGIGIGNMLYAQLCSTIN